jgi:hypothetical protein
VVGHQAVGVHEPFEPGDSAFEEPEEELIVDRLLADHLSAVAAVEDVMEGAFEVGTRSSGHAGDRSGAEYAPNDVLRS